MTNKQELLLIERMNAQSSFSIFTPGRTRMEIEPLPFYKHLRLLKATTFSTIPIVTMHYLLTDDNQVIKMNGTSEPILANNVQGGLILNKNTVVPYVTFIFDEVQSEQGTLRLTEKFDEDILTSQPTEEQENILRRNIRPTKITVTDEGFLLDAILLYGDAIYNAKIKVKSDGGVEICSEAVIAEGLPIRQIFLE